MPDDTSRGGLIGHDRGDHAGSVPSADGGSPASDPPAAEYLAELTRRLLIVLGVAGTVALAVLPVADRLLLALWNASLLTEATARPNLLRPLGFAFARLKLAAIVGGVVALPVFVHQFYRFLGPALYPQERRYYLVAVPTSLVLACLGAAVVGWGFLPLVLPRLVEYSQGITALALGINETIGLVLFLIAAFALLFQLPLYVVLAVAMGLTSREWLRERRLYFWGLFVSAAFLFSPDPTGMTKTLLAGTAVLLFELALLVTLPMERRSLQTRMFG